MFPPLIKKRLPRKIPEKAFNTVIPIRRTGTRPVNPINIPTPALSGSGNTGLKRYAASSQPELSGTPCFYAKELPLLIAGFRRTVKKARYLIKKVTIRNTTTYAIWVTFLMRQCGIRDASK
jgi:hypothetical protein